MPFSGIKVVIFDCDGVLIHSWNSTCYYFNRIRKEVGLPPMNQKEKEYAFIHSVEETLDWFIPKELREKAAESKKGITARDLLPRLTLEPGIDDLLFALEARGIKMAVDTNGGHEAREILESLDILKYFHLVTTADDVDRPKPFRDGVDLILKTLGATREESVFIGDSMVDQKTAAESGLTFWAYANPELNAKMHIRDFASLKALLEQTNC